MLLYILCRMPEGEEPCGLPVVDPKRGLCSFHAAVIESMVEDAMRKRGPATITPINRVKPPDAEAVM